MAICRTCWETAGSDDEEIIFAIPGHYSREQMALLLGIVRECPFRAVGLVDAAVAAIGEIQPDAERVLHVDALLHQGIITRLEGGDDWRRESVVDQPALGLAALRDAWINQIADVFIRETRFDPLHDAATEQRLFDRLDDWITALVDRPEVQVELETGDQDLPGRAGSPATGGPGRPPLPGPARSPRSVAGRRLGRPAAGRRAGAPAGAHRPDRRERTLRRPGDGRRRRRPRRPPPRDRHPPGRRRPALHHPPPPDTHPIRDTHLPVQDTHRTRDTHRIQRRRCGWLGDVVSSVPGAR
ncbi:MAG: hypothetical protein U5R48_08160 [Gammaproteobacteria bacterium]|nr:hypothetical protein [Gammaproteobacteria bacterium]